MLRNYLKVGFRNLTRNSVYSFINIVGLAIGLASGIGAVGKVKSLVLLMMC
jgi:putative ABC transport system permease protein